GCRRELGRAAESGAAPRERQRLWPTNVPQLYSVACEFALCVPLVGKGKADLSTAEQAERRQYAQQAMAALRQAVTAGYKDADQLTKDVNLASLQSREDFQKLLTELRAEGNTGAR